jgi:ABC-type cobalamin transport system ATPase subunit
LWYYLQHNAEAGDVVMIDEPELNLHPANQRILARLLVQMVNRGLYVVASTHSDYIVREINILLMLDKHPNRDALMKKHKIDGETISPKLVGAYNMSAQSGKIEPMQMDDEGMDAKTLDKVIDAQGDASDDIHFSNPK